MTKDRPHRSLVRVGERDAERSFSHPLNPRSEIHGVSLSESAGLERIGVHFIRVPPGKEANIYHLHHHEEEWWYVLEGRGIVEIDDQRYEVGPGDFMGFPTEPPTAHHLRNAGETDLVYLVGGERKRVEIAQSPHLGKVVLRHAARRRSWIVRPCASSGRCGGTTKREPETLLRLVFGTVAPIAQRSDRWQVRERGVSSASEARRPIGTLGTSQRLFGWAPIGYTSLVTRPPFTSTATTAARKSGESLFLALGTSDSHRKSWGGYSG